MPSKERGRKAARDQAKCERRDQHHAHVNGIDVACVSQRIHQWHEDYDVSIGSMKSPMTVKSANQQHNQMRIVASDAGDPVRDNNRTAQTGEKPTKRVGRADRDQRQGKNHTGKAEVIRKKPDVTAVKRRDYQAGYKRQRQHPPPSE